MAPKATYSTGADGREESVLKLIGDLSLLPGRACPFPERGDAENFCPGAKIFAFFALSQSGDEF